MARHTREEPFDKDPNARKDYSFDWTEWLDGDTITDSSWEADMGLSVVTSTISGDAKKTTAWLASGTVSAIYNVRNRITTAGGRIDDCTFAVRIIEQ